MNKQGYTLLEVTLFMAISGLLALVVMTSLAPRFRNARFTAGMREVQAEISEEATNLNKGLSGRADSVTCSRSETDGPVLSQAAQTTGSAEGCIINGRLFYFEANRMTSYAITSLRQAVSGGCETTNADTELKKFQDSVTCFKPRLLRQPVPVEITYPGGLAYKFSKGNSVDAAQWKGYGYLLDPQTNVIYSFVYLDAAPAARPCGADLANCNFPLAISGADRLVFKDSSTSYKPQFCFGLGSRYASLSGDTLSTTINLTFEDPECRV